MSDRSATSTIKGYFYQFDYSILEILRSENESDEFTIEGVEDLDIKTEDEKVAVQCKYYESTEYNHSVIAPAVRLMLMDFSKRKAEGESQIKYSLYGHYSKGQDKLEDAISLQFLKEKLLTHKIKGVEKKVHEELGLNDADLHGFLQKLELNILATSYCDQEKFIKEEIKSVFSVTHESDVLFYHNNAHKIIRDLAIKKDEDERRISKSSFLRELSLSKELLSDHWYIERIGREKYINMVKSRYFKTSLNQQAYERLFIIEVEDSDSIAELKSIVGKLVENFTPRDSKRQSDFYAPYLWFKGLTMQRLIELKRTLFAEQQVKFRDGFPFFGADFCVSHITELISKENQTKIRLISSADEANTVLSSITRTKEIYQFNLTEGGFEETSDDSLNVQVIINNIYEINQIL